MKASTERIINLIFILTPIACVLLIWQVGAIAVGSEYILPDIKSTLVALISLLKGKAFYRSLLGTLYRTAVAFAISFSIASVLAFLTRIQKRAETVISPLISILRALPTIAVIVLLQYWTNSKIASIVVTTLVVLPTSYSSMREAFFSVDNDLIKALKLFNVSEGELIKKVYFPAILPATLLAVGNGLTLNLKLMVAAEVLSATANSLGYLLNTSKVNYEVASTIAIVVITVAIGLTVEGVFRLISKKVGKWQ